VEGHNKNFLALDVCPPPRSQLRFGATGHCVCSDNGGDLREVLVWQRREHGAQCADARDHEQPEEDSVDNLGQHLPLFRVQFARVRCRRVRVRHRRRPRPTTVLVSVVNKYQSHGAKAKAKCVIFKTNSKARYFISELKHRPSTSTQTSRLMPRPSTRPSRPCQSPRTSFSA